MGANINFRTTSGRWNGDTHARAVLDSIRRLVRMLREASRASEQTLGISAAQRFVLERLVDAGKLTINQLAERTLTHQSSVSVVVGKLAKQGLVSRRRAMHDGRAVEIALTLKGRELLRRQSDPAPQDRLLEALGRMGLGRRRTLATSLDALIRTLRLADEPPAMFFEEGAPSPVSRARKAARG
jgi:MarR family transcriptional regulator, lower aerobic nicotinate degradation pathway regulator